MFYRRNFAIFPLIILLLVAIGCANPAEPEPMVYGDGGSDDRGGEEEEITPPPPPPSGDQFLKNAVIDAYLGNLDDPDVLAAATRGDILITDCSRFWGRSAQKRERKKRI